MKSLACRAYRRSSTAGRGALTLLAFDAKPWVKPAFSHAKGDFLGRLEGKIALITGAGGGLGLAMSKLFAAEGARVFMADLDGATAEAGAAEIVAGGGKAEAMRCDVSVQADVDAMIAGVKRVSDKLHIVVNNAGNLLR